MPKVAEVMIRNKPKILWPPKNSGAINKTINTNNKHTNKNITARYKDFVGNTFSNLIAL